MTPRTLEHFEWTANMTPEQRAARQVLHKNARFMKRLAARIYARKADQQPSSPIISTEAEEAPSSSTSPQAAAAPQVESNVNTPPEKILQGFWAKEYSECPHFSNIWECVHDPNQKGWPPGVSIHDNKLLQNQKICVPTALIEKIIAGQHIKMGHSGYKKLMKEVFLCYIFPLIVP